MTSLNRTEIDELLETASPEVLLEQEANRLDQNGRTYLQQKAAELAPLENLLQGAGQQYRKKIGKPPQLNVPALVKAEDSGSLHLLKVPQKDSWWLTAKVVDHRQLVAAAMAFVTITALLGLSLAGVIGHKATWNEDSWGLGPSRGTPPSSEQQRIDQELYDVLMERGRYSITLGQETKDLEYFSNALTDFFRARSLFPQKSRAYKNIAITLEYLGEKKKAQDYLKKALALETQD